MPTTSRVTKNGATFPEDDGEVQLTVYNPDGVTLKISGSDSAKLEVNGGTETSISGSIDVTLKAKTGTAGSMALYIIRAADATHTSDITLIELTVQFLEVRALPIKFMKVEDVSREGDASNVASLISETNSLLGPQANVWVFSSDVDGSNNPLVTTVAITSDLGDAVHGFETSAKADPSDALVEILLNLDSTEVFNFFYVWRVELYPGDPINTYAFTSKLGDTAFTLMEKGLNAEGQTVAHEIGHGLSYLCHLDSSGNVTDAVKYQHFDHDKTGGTYNHPDGHHRRSYNLMQIDYKTTGEYALSFTQAEIINECVAQIT